MGTFARVRNAEVFVCFGLFTVGQTGRAEARKPEAQKGTAASAAGVPERRLAHVRLSVDPRPMFHGRQADQITREDVGYLDAAVKMILDRGLAAEINIFADGEYSRPRAEGDQPSPPISSCSSSCAPACRSVVFPEPEDAALARSPAGRGTAEGNLS
jgi:hypothetical protein